MNTLIRTSVWYESKSILVSNINEDLWNKINLNYALLEYDKQRIGFAMKTQAISPFPTKEVKALREFFFTLGRLRRQLGGGGGFRDEIQDEVNEIIEKSGLPNKIKNQFKKETKLKP